MKENQKQSNAKIYEEKLNSSGVGIAAYIMAMLIPFWGLILGVIDLAHWKDGRDHSIGLIGTVVSIAMIAAIIYSVSKFIV